MHRQPARRDVLLLADLRDQLLGHMRVLAVLYGPADGAAAQDVKDHVEKKYVHVAGPLSLVMSHEYTSLERSASSSERRVRMMRGRVSPGVGD
jgi:hypothetical protein